MVIKRIHKEIELQYADKKQRAEEELRKRREKVYNDFPDIKAIDTIINKLGILLVYRASGRIAPLSLTKDLPRAYLTLDKDGINNRISVLQQSRIDILSKAGLSADYTDNAFYCKKCNDSGFVEVNGVFAACDCYKKLLSEKLRAVAGVPSEDVFDKFRLDLYSEKADEKKYGISISPRAQMEAIYKRCLRFAAEFENPNVKNMVFLGGSGLGKTFLGNCIINALTDKGISCLYMPATALFKPFAPGYYSQEDASELVDYIMNCQFLLIDDLGSEKQTATRYAELLEILNSREIKGRTGLCKTIITTNLLPVDLFGYYGERVTSRVLGGFDILKFAGEDIRLKKKNI